MSTIYGCDKFLGEVVQAISKKVAPIGAFSTQFSDEVANSATVNVGLVSTASTASVFAGNYEAATDNTVSKVTVTYQHLFKNFSWSPSDANKNELAKLDTVAGTHLNALINSVFGVATAGFVTQSFTTGASGVASATDFSLAKAKSGSMALAAKGVNIEESSLIVPSAYLIEPISVTGFNIAAQEAGKQGSYYGLKPYGVTEFSAGPTVKGVAAHKAAMAVATALPNIERGSATRFEKITDTNLGITILYREWTSMITGTTFGCFEVMAGAAVGNANAAVLITS